MTMTGIEIADPVIEPRAQCGCHRWPGDPCEHPAEGGDLCEACRRGCDFVARCHDQPAAERRHTWHGRDALAITVGGFYRARTRTQVFDVGWMDPGDTLQVSWVLGELP